LTVTDVKITAAEIPLKKFLRVLGASTWESEGLV